MAPVESIAQIPAQNLAVGVLRKLGDKLYPLWLLEAPKMLPAERDQCIRIDVGISFAQHDRRRDVFSSFRVGEAEDDRFADRWVARENVLDLARVNIGAPADDHVVSPIENVQMTPRIEAADIARL